MNPEKETLIKQYLFEISNKLSKNSIRGEFNHFEKNIIKNVEYFIKRSNEYTDIDGIENNSNILRIFMNYSETFNVAPESNGNVIFIKLIIRKQPGMIKCLGEIYLSYDKEFNKFSWIIIRGKTFLKTNKIEIEDISTFLLIISQDI